MSRLPHGALRSACWLVGTAVCALALAGCTHDPTLSSVPAASRATIAPRGTAPHSVPTRPTGSDSRAPDTAGSVTFASPSVTTPQVLAGQTADDHSPDAAIAPLNKRILGDIPALQRLGIQLFSWGPNPAGTKEVIAVYHLTARDTRLLDERYGAALIETRNSELRSATATGGSAPRR